MVSVLVGGRKRQEVLENHLNRIRNESREEGKTGRANLQFPPPDSLKPYTLLEWRFELPTAKSSEKTQFTWDASHATLIKRGYKRFPTSEETYSLIFDYLRAKDNTRLLEKMGEYFSIGQQLFNTATGNWFNQCVQLRGDTLTIYENETGIRWEETKKVYERSGPQKFTSFADFKIPPKQTNPSIRYFRQLPDDLISYLIGRSYNCFPESMKHHTILFPEPDSSPQPLALAIVQSNLVGITLPQYGLPWAVRPRNVALEEDRGP